MACGPSKGASSRPSITPTELGASPLVKLLTTLFSAATAGPDRIVANATPAAMRCGRGPGRTAVGMDDKKRKNRGILVSPRARCLTLLSPDGPPGFIKKDLPSNRTESQNRSSLNGYFEVTPGASSFPCGSPI